MPLLQPGYCKNEICLGTYNGRANDPFGEPEIWHYIVSLVYRTQKTCHKEGVAIMCRAMEEMRNQSFKEGEAKNKRTIALRMIKAGKYALDEISAISGLPLEEVKKLSAELQS